VRSLECIGRYGSGLTPRNSNHAKFVMRKGLYLLSIVLVLIGADAKVFSASAKPACDDYFYNADGSWSPRYVIVITGSILQITLDPQDRLRAGMRGLAGRIGAYLDEHCNNEAPSTGPRIPQKP
jgi:hypothetical protein